ncbi:MAG: beta-barrel assembly-enhancing protease [Methylococcaceae bacterium]
MNIRTLLTSLLISTHLSVVQAETTSVLPDMGDPTGTLMTPLQETQLGAAFFRSLHGQLKIDEDPEVLDFIQSLGQKLTAVSDTPTQTFHFFVVNDPAINAFAGPGGYIGVNSGLILTSESESELASVLGHEIAHVTQRHIYQAIQAAGRLSLPAAAAMLVGVLLGAKAGGGQMSQAAIVAAQAAVTQFQINFTRDNEAEADRVGMQVLSKSGFDPRAMPSFFERMQQSTRFAGRNIPEFLLTHPVTVSRISDTRGRAEQFPYRQYPDSFAYSIIRAKLRVSTAANPQDSLNHFKALETQGDKMQRDVTRYGLALSLVANSRLSEARPLLKKLVSEYPDQSQFAQALAQIEVEDKNFQEAARLFERALDRFPDNRAMTLSYVRVLLTTGKPEQARKLLDGYIRYQGANPDVYELLGETYSRLGQEAESHRYLGEAYYAAGQTRAAIIHYRLAQKVAGNNYYLNAVIDERLRQFLAEEAERRKQ